MVQRRVPGVYVCESASVHGYTYSQRFVINDKVRRRCPFDPSLPPLSKATHATPIICHCGRDRHLRDLRQKCLAYWRLRQRGLPSALKRWNHEGRLATSLESQVGPMAIEPHRGLRADPRSGANLRCLFVRRWPVRPHKELLLPSGPMKRKSNDATLESAETGR